MNKVWNKHIKILSEHIDIYLGGHIIDVPTEQINDSTKPRL